MAAPSDRVRTLFASAGGTFLVTFDGAAVQMVQPVLRGQLHTQLQSVQWTMTAYLLVSTAAYLPTGRLGDVYGRARVWYVGLAVFLVGSLACALSPSLPWLIAARSLQALGAAAITANSAPLMLDAYPPQLRARALAIGSVAIGAALLFGPPAGALLTRVASWRLLFAVALPLGAVVYWVARGHLPPRQPQPRPLDAWGALLSCAGLGGLIAALSQSGGWHATTVVLLVGGVAALVAFVLVERPREHPLLPLPLLASRAMSTGAGSSLLGYAALFAATTTIPYLLIDVQHRSLVGAGLMVGALPVALSAAAPPSGWLADRAGARWVCAAGLALVCAGLVLAALAPRHGPSTLLALAAVGAGLGAYESPNSAASLGPLPREHYGVGSAVLGVARNLGMTLGAASAAGLLGHAAAAGVPAGAGTVEVAAVQRALIVGAALAALGAGVAALRTSSDARTCDMVPCTA